MARLESESEARDDSEFRNPLDGLDLSLEYKEILSEASEPEGPSEEFDPDLLEPSEPSELSEPSEPSEPPEPSEPSELSEPSEPKAAPKPSPKASVGEDAIQWGSGLAAEQSDGSELGEAELPQRLPDPPKSRGRGGIIAGAVVLLIAAAIAYIVFT